jgi:hypothetical protein
MPSLCSVFHMDSDEFLITGRTRVAIPWALHTPSV